MERERLPGCLVMAAGNGSRFGGNKLAAGLEGRSLIRRTLEAVPAAWFTRVVVVTQFPEIEALAREFGFLPLRNDRPEAGISRTIRLGVTALEDCPGILCMVSDQPLLDQAAVEKIVRLWLDHPERIAGACHRGRRGNPNLFPKALFPALKALRGDRGGRTVIQDHEALFLPVELGEALLQDVDTPAALEKLAEQL